MLQVDRLRREDCPQVAALHLSCLRTPFSGRAGRKLLTYYYQVVAQEMGACGYVARDERQVLGFVCGVWQPDALRRRLLCSQWLALGWWAAWQVVIKPSLLVDLARRFGDVIPEAQDLGYELRPIAVAPQARRGGIATLLVNALLADAQQRGFSRVFLYTEADNPAAQAFYRKIGFQLTGKVIRSGVIYLRFERSTDPADYESSRLC